MRFWQKTLVLMLVLFVVVLDVSVIMIMNKSWQLNMRREQQRAASDQALIANNIYENLNSIKSRGMPINDTILLDVARSYGEYYQERGISLQLSNQDVLIYAGPSEPSTRHISITNELPAPYGHLQLTYRRDIEAVYAGQDELTRYFVYINCISIPVLAALMYVLIRKLTKPLQSLADSTKSIAEGNYGKRVLLKNRDEFGELAQHFNRMAYAVERQVTDLSAMAEEKQRMVDNLAHELRTPLTSLQGFAQYLNAAHIDEEERVTASGYLWSETLRLKNLVFKLLDLSILSHQPVKRSRIPVVELFESVRRMEQANLDAAGIELILDADIPAVWGDRELLESFLVNCLENSIHASTPGSEIRLAAYEQDTAAVLEVTDSGRGMSAAHLERVFEPFYRVDHARSREHGGAGLGLALCRQIAEAHQAQLSLKSEEQKGTTIQLILQLHNNGPLTL
ncbi:HAMP domain-containing sensor histidine kinase [Paenibacillus graminis]|uniref:sensor histidine kinase n=1 Tax=Paenibacillus graminis TaxID=189425 RepID=UPI002DBA7B3A|nr:HAMP domain-containing sensor histidine kinase [Paenibacillus graminis]MEC0168728.1 HAMP domain-containing sensor histidine kinase [Paenibacillus graminis]